VRRVAPIAATLLLAACGGSKHQPQFAKLRNGMTKAQVRALVGRAETVVQIPYPVAGSLDEGFEECWDYGLKTVPKTPLYQLCFWGSRLTSHARYG
jgi:hypothetical protein